MSGRLAGYVQTVRSADPAAFKTAVSGTTFEPCQLGVASEPSRYARLSCPAVTFDVISLGVGMIYDGRTADDRVTFGFAVECPDIGHSFTFGVEHRDAALAYFAPGTPLSGTKPAGYRHASLTMPVGLFRRSMARLDIALPEALAESGGIVPVPPDQGGRLRDLCRNLEDELWLSPAGFGTLASRRGAEAKLIAAFLSAFGSGIGAPQVTRVPAHSAKRRYDLVSRARRYIRSELPSQVRLDDLCADLGLGRRRVEALFRDMLDLSPTAFILHERLHSARESLRRAAPESGTVKRVALECGFRHMGRFSSDFHRLFGELPSETLRMAPGPDASNRDAG